MRRLLLFEAGGIFSRDVQIARIDFVEHCEGFWICVQLSCVHRGAQKRECADK
jgi:hypothetical protein